MCIPVVLSSGVFLQVVILTQPLYVSVCLFLSLCLSLSSLSQLANVQRKEKDLRSCILPQQLVPYSTAGQGKEILSCRAACHGSCKHNPSHLGQKTLAKEASVFAVSFVSLLLLSRNTAKQKPPVHYLLKEQHSLKNRKAKMFSFDLQSMLCPSSALFIHMHHIKKNTSRTSSFLLFICVSTGLIIQKSEQVGHSRDLIH